MSADRSRIVSHLSRVVPSCTFRVVLRQLPRGERGPPGTPSARPTCPSCSARRGRCSQPIVRWLFVGYLEIIKKIYSKNKLFCVRVWSEVEFRLDDVWLFRSSKFYERKKLLQNLFLRKKVRSF